MKTVHYALIKPNGKVYYGFNEIQIESEEKRHLWSSYNFILESDGKFYYKVKGADFQLLQEDDYCLVSRKIDSEPDQWELYGLLPIFKNGVCLEKCTVLRKLWYVFFEPTGPDFLEYIRPREPDGEPWI